MIDASDRPSDAEALISCDADLDAALMEAGRIAAARGLMQFVEAQDLECVATTTDGREICLASDAARAWREMHAAARNEGVSLVLVSGFRSVARQAEIIAAKLAAGELLGAVLEVCAAPGFSEHHSGRAVDLASDAGPVLEEAFEATPAFLWLTRRAKEFGFSLSYPPGNAQGYCYEPWHWCYHPRACTIDAP